MSNQNRNILLGAAVLAGATWFAKRSGDRARLKAKLAADPRAVFIPSIENAAVVALPVFSMKSVEQAFNEVVAPFPAPPKYAKEITQIVDVIKDAARSSGHDGTTAAKGDVEPVVRHVEPQLDAAARVQKIYEDFAPNVLRTTFGDAGSSVAKASDVFGPQTPREMVGVADDNIIDFDEWAKNFAGGK